MRNIRLLLIVLGVLSVHFLCGCTTSQKLMNTKPLIQTEKNNISKHKQEVINTLNQYINAINTDNRSLLAKLSRHEFMTYSRREGEDESYTTRIRPQSYYLDMNREKGSTVLERISSPHVSANEQLAIAWAPYEFNIEGKFSHCGINAFTFIKENDMWKVVSANWTVRKSDCN